MGYAGVSLRAVKLTGCENDFAVWFDYLEESYSYKEDQFKTFCQPVKTSWPPAENVNETPGYAENERAGVTNIHVTYFNSTLGGVEPSVLLELPLPIDTLSCSCSKAASVSNRVSRSKS